MRIVHIPETLIAGLLVGLLAVAVSPAWALCDGTGDDTAAIQALIDADAVLPAGRCPVRSLNATDRMAPRIVGQGAGATILLPLEVDRPVLDLTGADFGIVRDLQIGEPAWPVVPSIGLLIAYSGTHDGANRFDIENVQITGRYRLASLYIFGAASSSIRNSAFWNFSGTSYAAIFTTNNPWGVTSAFAQIAAPGVSYAADWDLFRVEFHTQIPSGRSDIPTIVCEGCSSIRHFGGTVAGSGPCLVWFWGSASPISFFVTGFYSDNGTPPAATFCGGPVHQLGLFNVLLSAPLW